MRALGWGVALSTHNLVYTTQDNQKVGWRDWLDIALEVGNLIGMGFNAFMFFKLKFANSNIFSRAPRNPNVREETISMHKTSSCSEVTQSLDDI